MALGAEEMVEKLTDKNLDLEEKIEQLEETVQDLVSILCLTRKKKSVHPLFRSDPLEFLKYCLTSSSFLIISLAFFGMESIDKYKLKHTFRNSMLFGNSFPIN